MPYDADQILVAFGGTIYGTEEWTSTLRLAFTNGIVDTTDLIGYCVANGSTAKTKISTWMASTASMGTQVKLEWVKFNAINRITYRYLDEDNSNTYPVSPAVNGTGSSVLPPQCTLAATLTTGAARGLAHSGRIYFPTLALNIDSTGLVQASPADTYCNSVKSLIDQLNLMPSMTTEGVPKVTIMSKGHTDPDVPVGPGMRHRVTGVKVGRVMDTQRRRRKDFPETYTSTLTIA